MPHATANITGEQRDAIYDLLVGRLTFLSDLRAAVEQEDFETANRLVREFSEDFRLLEDLGWGPDQRPQVPLTIPAASLPAILERLRAEAEGGLSESAEERDSREAEEASRRCWRLVSDTASELLAELQRDDVGAGMTAADPAALPAPIPPQINHAVLTGSLAADPQQGRSPTGEPVTLLRVEFPVVDPDRPKSLWRCASCLVEVPDGRSARDIELLRGGSPVLAAGQISDRWAIEGGHTSRCGVIVASMVKGGPPEAAEGLVL